VRGLGKRGVVGESVDADGIGIFGKGGILAGHFEGDVKITGKVTVNSIFSDALTIQGVSIQIWLQRIVALEQRDNTLQQQINSLNQQVNSLQQQLASQVNSFHQQLATLQQQLSTLQQQEIADRQDEVNGIQILAARITNLGG
jgi:flagellar capping protein FliD